MKTVSLSFWLPWWLLFSSALQVAFGSLYRDEVLINPSRVIALLAAASMLQLVSQGGSYYCSSTPPFSCQLQDCHKCWSPGWKENRFVVRLWAFCKGFTFSPLCDPTLSCCFWVEALQTHIPWFSSLSEGGWMAWLWRRLLPIPCSGPSENHSSLCDISEIWSNMWWQPLKVN